MEFKKYYFSEVTINAKEIGSIPPEQEELMAIGKNIADKYGLKFNGWWEIAYTFTTKEGDTFLAKDEKEVIQKLKKFYPNESTNLQEMPHLKTDDLTFDFKMEKQGWPDRLVKIIHIAGKHNVDEILSPFYGIYKLLFVKKFNELSDNEKQLLKNKLPKQFLIDMGVE